MLVVCLTYAMPALNEWRVTQSFRVAVFSHENKLGQEILLDVDGKTKLCKHGETASTIRTWLHNEARAAAEGVDPPPRNSSCDCRHTLGVGSSVRTRPPTPPPSLSRRSRPICQKIAVNYAVSWYL